MSESLSHNTLSKDERLSGKNGISALMSKGKFGNVGVMKYCIRLETEHPCNRVLVSVPKRLFKRAVKRNLLKRRIRESYRLQKHDLTRQSGMDVMFLYNTSEILDFQTVYKTVGDIIRKINGTGTEK